jgi:hypothetical protein
MQNCFNEMRILLSDAPDSFNQLKGLWQTIDNTFNFSVDIKSLIKSSINFDDFKEQLQNYCNVNNRKNNDLNKKFFILLNIIAQNSSSYRNFKSMVELYNIKLYENKLSNKEKNNIRRINEIFNEWVQSTQYKSKEEWNSFYHRKAVESPSSFIASSFIENTNLFSSNSKRISLNNYKKLNNTELKIQEKLNKLKLNKLKLNLD